MRCRMGFRTIAITKRAKLNLTMGFLEVRGEETKRIFLDDIDILLIENQANDTVLREWRQLP